MPTEKPTFAATVDQLNTDRIRSNLQNLAHARIHAEQHITELEERLAKAKELITEINDLAPEVEAGGGEAKVKEIYAKAQGRGDDDDWLRSKGVVTKKTY